MKSKARYIADAHGTQASFAGSNLPGLVRFETTPSSCSRQDTTGIDTGVEGSGQYCRAYRQFHPGPIEPGGMTVELLVPSYYAAPAAGSVGQVSVGGPWGTVSHFGFLVKATVGGSVGDLVRTTLEFQFI